MPDLMVMHPRERLVVVLGIELKAGKGKPTAEQLAMAEAFKAVNASYEFCWSLDDVVHALSICGIPVYAKVWGRGVRITGKSED